MHPESEGLVPLSLRVPEGWGADSSVEGAGDATLDPRPSPSQLLV